MTSQMQERPAGAFACALWPLHNWAQKELAKGEPPPRDPGEPVPLGVRLLVAGLFTLRMILTGLLWLRERYSRAWLYVWERRHGEVRPASPS
jgi:hypothetical protein